MEQKLLNEQQLAEMLNINVTFLRRDRVASNVNAGTCKFRFIRLGTLVRYKIDWVNEDLAAHAKAAMNPQPKPAAPPKSTDGQQPRRPRGRPMGSTKAKQIAAAAAAAESEARNG